MRTQKIESACKRFLCEAELELVSGGLSFAMPEDEESYQAMLKTMKEWYEGLDSIPSAPPTPPVGGDDALAAAAGSPPNPPGGGWSNITIGAIVVGGIAAIGGLGYAGYKYYKKRTSHSGSHKIK